MSPFFHFSRPFPLAGFGPSTYGRFSDVHRGVILDIADKLQQWKHCNESVTEEPMIVPPSWNKGEGHALQPVWRHAARELSEARYLVFIGYSFPATDLYFRYLLGLGLASETRIRRIVVLDPSEAAPERLNGWLSPTLRTRVHYESKKFSEGLPLHRQLLDVRPISP